MNELLSNKIQIETLQRVFTKKQYPLSVGVHYLNIFGVRAGGGFTNTFDDILGVIYKNPDDKWALEKFEATTDPGKNALLNPINKDGAGILVPNYYPDVWDIGLHKGQYEALVQRGIFKLYRDNNRDLAYDMEPETVQSGENNGVNCHHAGSHSVVINDWSYACQVLAVLAQFNRLMELARLHRSVYRDYFCYALFDEKDFS